MQVWLLYRYDKPYSYEGKLIVDTFPSYEDAERALWKAQDEHPEFDWAIGDTEAES